ncbi:A1S_2505 family phage non-structural protein [Glaciibacter flavus]|uniref:A1S_2505 family phage non-structural protein n=1 Tax=Orlajensenia flava TaxID=2565934 RepID=UPI003AFFC154
MITELGEGEIFVFGSNASGAHGGGAARYAYDHFGAVWGQGEGLQGRSYGIDTMSGFDVIADEVAEFLEFAEQHPQLRFLVTEIGCGIAGYRPVQIAPLFTEAPDNVVLPQPFMDLL